MPSRREYPLDDELIERYRKQLDEEGSKTRSRELTKATDEDFETENPIDYYPDMEWLPDPSH
jgi:hypothetical protein